VKFTDVQRAKAGKADEKGQQLGVRSLRYSPATSHWPPGGLPSYSSQSGCWHLALLCLHASGPAFIHNPYAEPLASLTRMHPRGLEFSSEDVHPSWTSWLQGKIALLMAVMLNVKHQFAHLKSVMFVQGSITDHKARLYQLLTCSLSRSRFMRASTRQGITNDAPAACPGAASCVQAPLDRGSGAGLWALHFPWGAWLHCWHPLWPLISSI